MATPRKHWFRVADSVLTEDWTNDQAAAFMRLGAYLNTRWARDGKEGREAGHAVISAAHVCAISGKRRLDVARKSLESLGDILGMSVEHRGQVTEINWPKFSDFQRYESRSGETSGQDAPPVLPPPQDARRKTQEEEELTPSELAAAEPAAALDPLERPLRLLSQEPGSLEAKRLWLAKELPLIEAEVAQIEPNGKTRSQHFRSTLIRYWRQSRAPQRKLDDRMERTRQAAMGALLNKGVFER